MFTVKKFFFFFPLRWGMLAIAIFHVVSGSLIVAAHTVHHPEDLKWEIYLNINMLFIHIIGCALLIVSIWVRRSVLPLVFLITDIIFMVWNVIGIVHCFLEEEYAWGGVLIFFMFLVIYLFLCAFSWHAELQQDEHES